jgi:MFS family permease
MTQKLHRNIALLYAYTVCIGAIFTLPVFLLYYKDKMELTFQDFLFGEAVFALIIILCEVPTGWLSDKWSRKGTLILGVVTLIIGYSLLLLANSLTDAIIAQGTLGVAVALASGTTSALIYDTLLETNDVDQYTRIAGKTHGLGLYGMVFASIAGGFLYKIDMHLPLISDIGTLLIAFVILMFIQEPKRHKAQNHKHPIKDMLETIHFTLKGHIEIAGIVMLGTILFTATKIIVWGQQTYFQETNIPVEWFGILVGAGGLLGGLGGHFGHKIGHDRSNKMVLGVLIGLIACATLIAGYATHAYAVPLLMVGGFVWGFGNPRIQAAINHRVGSQRRAAILSTASMMVNLLFIPISFVAGYLSNTYHIGVTFMILGAWVMFSGSVALALWNHREK